MARLFDNYFYSIACVASIAVSVGMATDLGAQQAQQPFATPRHVFDAYKKAISARDWKAAFALFTPERQNCEISQIAIFGAAHPQQRKALELQGVNLQEVDRELKSLEQSGQLLSSRGFAAITNIPAAKKIAIYVASHEYFIRASDGSSETLEALKNLKVDLGSAQGECTGVRQVIETQQDLSTNVTRQVPRSFSFVDQMRFRNVAGSWLID